MSGYYFSKDFGFKLQPCQEETGTPIYPGEDGETSDGRMIDRYFV